MKSNKILGVVIGVVIITLSAGSSSAHMPSLNSLRWLEAPTSARALLWANKHTQRSLERLRAMPEYPKVLADLETSLKANAPIPRIILLGPRALRLERNAAHPYGLLQVARRRPSGGIEAWRTVLDVGALRASEGKPYELQWLNPKDMCLPPQYDRCLLTLSPRGGDEVELREFDLDKGKFVEGGFRASASRTSAVWLNLDHVLIAHTLYGSPKTVAGWPAAVYDWSRGQSLKGARKVFEGSPTDAIMQMYGIGQGATRRAVVVRAVNFSDFKLALIAADGTVTPVKLPTQLKAFGLLATTDHDLIVQLAGDTEVNGRRVSSESLLAYDIAARDPARRIQVIYTPAAGWYLNDTFFGGIDAASQGVYFVVAHGLVPHLFFAESRGRDWRTGEVRAAKPGESFRLSGADPSGKELIVLTTGFLTPTRQEVWGPSGRRALLQQEKPEFDASKFVVEAKSAVSRDGTAIDYLLLRPRDLPVGARTPTLMTGYGAFGLTLTPDYLGPLLGGRAFKEWLDRDGALAVPAIRGGGDRGEAWHQVAMRKNRQLSYDDFIAVAEALVKSGFTTPAHLGVFGTSNGGLLAAVMGTERPDLFGAVVSDVPLTDMLRLPNMGMGAAWIN